jgi:hypothetical protein
MLDRHIMPQEKRATPASFHGEAEAAARFMGGQFILLSWRLENSTD